MRQKQTRWPTTARQRLIASVVCIAIIVTGSGCGTVFYGRTQKIALNSSPTGAVASLANVETTTPGEVRLARNQPGGWAILRAASPGYQPACMAVPGRFHAAFLVMDGLFLALPLLVDLIGMGSINALRRYPEAVSLTLHPLEPDQAPQPLPSDAEIIHFRRLTWVDLCQPNDLKNASVSTTQCASKNMRIEAAGGDATKVWWTFYCDEESFRCLSDRRFRQVACSESSSGGHFR